MRRLNAIRTPTDTASVTAATAAAQIDSAIQYPSFAAGSYKTSGNVGAVFTAKPLKAFFGQLGKQEKHRCVNIVRIREAVV